MTTPTPAPPTPRDPLRDRATQPVARLLDAVRAIGSDLELPVVLRHLVDAAVTLVDARYGALGVVDASGEGLSEFITVGMDAATVGRIGPAPSGLGVLGELLRTPEPLRLLELSQHVRSVGFPAGHPPMGSFVGVPVRVGDVVFGNLYLTDKRGGLPFTADDEEVLVALAVAAGVAVRNARLYEQARRGSAWREAGRAVSTSLLSGTARADVITLLAETSRRVLDADSVFLALVEGEELHLATSAGQPGPGEDEALLVALLPVLLSGKPCLAASSGLSGFAVPLGPDGGRCSAVLAALWATPPNPLLVDDLQGFAAQAAVALELAQRRDTAQQGALVADRDRIGRDLHDLVIQRLFATGMRLQSAVRLVPSDPGEAVRRVDLAVDDLDATIRELRSTIHGLQAPLDGRPSLRARLLEAVDAGSVHLGFAPALRLDGLLDTLVPPETGEHALAVVREGLSNAARHARAARLEVSVVLREGQLHVVVEDDGVGVDPAAGSSGLLNLSSRALGLGGELSLDAGPLGGARLTWTVPVAA
ncbi:MAG: devS [Frankiales bacterium]|nr:devS [Frankiales bacterium]